MPLSDRSFIGILIGKKLDKTDFTDFDKITLQILLQVSDNSYKSFLNQKKEKELIFNLNEKISQLNNLTDAGIELSRYEKRSYLYELALERASTLTNSTSSLIRIAENNKNDFEEYFTFPKGINPDIILKSELKIESFFNYRDKSYHLVLSGKEARKGITSFNELDKLLLDA